MSESTTTAATTESPSNEVKLQRRVGLWGAVSMVVGIIIGSGIFITPAGVTAGAGSVGLSLIMWMVGGLASLCGALSLVELALMVPLSGGQYIYILTFTPRPVAFLLAWSNGFLIYPGRAAVVASTCAKYILVPFYNSDYGDPPTTHIRMLAVCVIFYVAAQNMWSAPLSAKIQIIFTVAKVSALMFIIGGGFYYIGIGHTENISTGFKGTNSDFGPMMSGLPGALFAYIGWENVVAITEEIIDPEKNLVRGMYIAMALVTMVYLLANISYLAVMSVPEMLASSAVVMTWAETIIPMASWVLAVCVAMSTFGGVNGNFFTSSRMYLSYARERHLMQLFAMINVNRYTPMAATLLQACICSVMVFLGDVQQLIGFTQIIQWTFFGITMALIPYLRWKRPEMKRPYRVPLVFPIVGVLFCVVTVVAPVALDPRIEYVLAVGLCLVGLVFYIPFVLLRWTLPGWDHVTTFAQLVMNVAHTDYKQI